MHTYLHTSPTHVALTAKAHTVASTLRHGEQQSKLSFAWLLDHAKENREPGTGQRRVRISQFGAAQSGLRPLEVRTKDGTLEIRWPESVEQHGGSRISRFLVSELLDTAGEVRPLEDSRVAWGAQLFSQEGHPTVAAAELRCEEGLRGALLRLRDYGVLRLREMPSSSRETRELVEVPRHATPRHATPRHATPRHTLPHPTAALAALTWMMAAQRIGEVLPTFYGEMWSTRAEAGQTEGVSDTAYSNAGIRPHTDGTYFRDPPGLQARCAPAPASHRAHQTRSRALVRSRIAGSRLLALAH